MGLFGGGNSNRTSNNYDQRVINDYGGATFDNSVTNDLNTNYEYQLDSSNNGQFAGANNVNYTATDGGAFEIVNSANNAMAGVASDSISLAAALGGQSINAGVEISNNSQGFALSAINANSDIVNQYGDLATAMLDRTLSSNDSALNNSAMMIDNSNQRTLDAALNFNQSSLLSQQLTTDFAKDLVMQNGEIALAQQSDNNNALNNGFKSMMQFADSFSRSDGAALAQNNNKTMLYLIGGLAVSIFIFKKVA